MVEEEEKVMFRRRRGIAILLHGCNEEMVNYSLELIFIFRGIKNDKRKNCVRY